MCKSFPLSLKDFFSEKSMTPHIYHHQYCSLFVEINIRKIYQYLSLFIYRETKF